MTGQENFTPLVINSLKTRSYFSAYFRNKTFLTVFFLIGATVIIGISFYAVNQQGRTQKAQTATAYIPPGPACQAFCTENHGQYKEVPCYSQTNSSDTNKDDYYKSQCPETNFNICCYYEEGGGGGITGIGYLEGAFSARAQVANPNKCFVCCGCNQEIPPPTDPVPTDPAPTDPVPTDPVLTDPVPTNTPPTDLTCPAGSLIKNLHIRIE